MYSTRYFRQILIKLKLSRQIFEKYSNIKFYENPFTGSRVVALDGGTDRQTDIMKLIVDFRNLETRRKTSLTLYKLTKSNLTNPNFTIFYHINVSPNYMKELPAYLSDIAVCTNPLTFPHFRKKKGYQNQCCDTLFVA